MSNRSVLRNPYAIVPSLCLLIYCFHAQPAPLNYFRELADAFMHGQLHLLSPERTQDLVFYEGRYYLYWPPAPALVFMPLVAVFGDNISDNLMAALFGAANVGLFMHACRLLSTRFKLGLLQIEIAALGIFWGLGTVHFCMSCTGDVWFISQVMAQTALLAAIVCFLARKPLLLSGLFFALAAYTRNNLVFSAFFFLALHRALLPHHKGTRLLRDGLLFALPFLLCTLANGWYNWARFGDVFENGLRYHQMDEYFLENFRRYGYFSFHYLPHNLYTEVFHAPTLITRPPFIQEEPEGFGFLWASPLFFWLFPAGALWLYRLFAQRKIHSHGFWWLTAGSLITAMLIATIIFLIMGTGWVQFAARYTLDFQVFLLFFLLAMWPAMRKLPRVRAISAILITLSVAIQSIGAGKNNWW